MTKATATNGGRRALALLILVGAAAWGALVPAAAGPAADFSGAGSADPVPAPDFNDDGYADLAVGLPAQDIDSKPDAGAVNVLYGSPGGIAAAGDQMLHMDVLMYEGAADGGGRFGAALAHGDFDSDTYTDLAIGIPGDLLASDVSGGSVAILHGSEEGLDLEGEQLFNQDVSDGGRDGLNGVDILGVGEEGDGFGEALATADFDGDGHDDLAIGVPGEDLGSASDAGAAQVLIGTPDGLTSWGNQLWHQNSPNVTGAAQSGDRFGRALAAGDFDGDGRADLAVGLPGQAVGDSPGAGAVQVLYAGSEGLEAAGNQIWHQDSPSVIGTPQTDGLFGSALAAADFDRDGRDNLAIGAPGAGVNSVAGTGAVNVLDGMEGGLTAAGSQRWHQDVVGVQGTAEDGDRFGTALAAGNFDGDGYPDLAIGVPREDVQSIEDAGSVNVLYSGSGGLAATADQSWHQDVEGVQGTAEDGDRFGSALSTADFGGDGRADLAIAVPREDLNADGVTDAGLVHVLRGSPDDITAAGDQVWHQNVEGVEGAAQDGDRYGKALS